MKKEKFRCCAILCNLILFESQLNVLKIRHVVLCNFIIKFSIKSKLKAAQQKNERR